MKCYIFFIYLVLIKAQKNEELKDMYTSRYENEFENNILFEEELFYEYKYHYNDKPVLNLMELMKQPQLPGYDDENWPYRKDEDPFSQYYKHGCKKCQCGIQNKKRIVNGSYAKRGEFPWQVLITYKRRFNCAGSILNDLFVLTAAHCLFGYKKHLLKLRFGAFKRHTTPAIYRAIDRMWIGKGYNPKTFFHDIGIIKLKTKIRITPNVRPICLPIPGDTYAGDLATVSGWGALSFGGKTSEVLKKAQLPVLSNEQCRKTGYGNSITPSQVCAGNQGKDSCSGDSGGPLTVFQKGRRRQIGIVSFGRECNLKDYPGVYTRVTSFLPYITRLASKGGACWCMDNF